MGNKGGKEFLTTRKVHVCVFNQVAIKGGQHLPVYVKQDRQTAYENNDQGPDVNVVLKNKEKE